MSGVELLGFACSIMQVISFSREVISLCSNVYQGKHPDADLAEIATSLQAVSSDVQTGFDTRQPKTADERRFCDIATRCAIAARDLEEELSFITSRQTQGSLTSTLRVAAKTTWRKRRLDRLEKSLQEYERVLDTHLMARMCKQSDAIELQQKEEFEKLGADFQHFVSQYALGHKKLRELVRSDIQISQRASEKAMKAHVTEEVARSQFTVLSHIDSKAEAATKEATRRLRDLKIQTRDDRACERLLQSLKYPAMNERHNQLTDSHRGTFKWIFQHHEHSKNDDNDGEWYIYDKETRMAAPQDAPWDDFQGWLKSDSNIYWISGKPGSGKSTLMKFLISNPLTKEALRTWRSDVEIISHFFWKPGSMAQKNVKGLFASLLYQLLSSNKEYLQTMLVSPGDLQQKDSDTDWSTTELRSVCLSTMRSYPSSICIFLDGLDEICDEDGVHGLMEILDTFKTISGIKICVASRPEQRFKLYLSQIPQLKVHNLTSGDISRYAAQTLRPFWRRRQDIPDSLMDYEVLPELLSKAQGVFLWIRLAVKSLIIGLESGDSSADIIMRLRELPSELSQMYADMWTRVNGNTKVHRESTAKLLRLIIDHGVMSSNDSDRYSEPRPLCVVDIMGATDVTIQNELLLWHQEPTTEAAIHSCIRARELIELRCIGLVETTWSEGTDDDADDDANGATDDDTDDVTDYKASLRPHALPTVNFIHRTAYDFLTDTEEGRHILSYDSSQDELRLFQLLRGLLVAAAVTHETDFLDFILAKLAELDHSLPQKMTEDLLKICWRLYNQNFIERLPMSFGGLKQHFLVRVTSPKFGDFLVESINRSPQPSALATEVLRERAVYYVPRTRSREFLITRRSRELPRTYLPSELDFLVSLGADLILKGRVYGRVDDPVNLNGSSVTESWSVLQEIIINYLGEWLLNSNLRENPITDAALHELTKFCWDHETALAEPLCMSMYLDQDEFDCLFFEAAKSHSKPEHSQGAQTDMDIEISLEKVEIVVEAKAAFWLEVSKRRQRRQKAWPIARRRTAWFEEDDQNAWSTKYALESWPGAHRQKSTSEEDDENASSEEDDQNASSEEDDQDVSSEEDELQALSTVFEDQTQDHSSIRLRYLLFKQMSVDIEEGMEAWCRVQDQESMQHIEQLIESWLFGEMEAADASDLWNALTRVHDDFVAGSRAYERVHGDIRERLADDGLGYCKISKEEIDKRFQHLREEDPDAPGHWL